jgi:hypothetical protein
MRRRVGALALLLAAGLTAGPWAAGQEAEDESRAREVYVPLPEFRT